MALVLWSTGPKGDPTSIAHAMPTDNHGRPRAPICGADTHGLYFRPEIEWEQVPLKQRCETCSAAQA